VRSNLLTYALMCAAGAAAAAYLLLKGVATRHTIAAFFMAWGNTYGLMLCVLLMGHGVSAATIQHFMRLYASAVHY
jgi:hypothetical protein